MRTLATITAATALAVTFAYGATPQSKAPQQGNPPQWEGVAQALGKSGTVMPGGIYRVAMPRTDLHVTLDGVALKAGFALGSWVAFQPMGDQAMVMGDLVLTESEIAPVMSKLQEGGLEVTALHNHLLRAKPVTFYMHVMGHGRPAKLAQSLHEAIAASKTPLVDNPVPQTAEPKIDLDTAMLDQTIGDKGHDANGVYQFGISRAEPIRDYGMTLPAAMGSAEAINFQPTGNGKAAITGDFVLIGSEVTPVARALRENGIEVTAIHNHMLDEQPRVFFMHFWANDDATKLARGLRAALDKVHTAKSQDVAKKS
jgi:hypothetical protein